MSYSKVFKASHLSVLNEVKVIEQPVIPLEISDPLQEEDEADNREMPLVRQEVEQLLQHARAQAKEIVEQAQQQARSLERSAEQQIDQWWEENQKKMEQLSLEAEQKGYQDGFQRGQEDGLIQIGQEYEARIEEARNVLLQAYEEKESIVAEAEPFLLELSSTIASHIVKQELESYPDKFVALIKQHILRFKEKDSITVCVHPEDFPFIEGQRAQLLALVNGETEIKILPDHSVTLKGCVIRTAYGSVDACIDTQLEEIKKVMLEARREPEDAVSR
jgi:flagellar assembly protein FliH